VNKKRIVITGIGVISPLGSGREDFFSALLRGDSGVKPVSLFDTSGFKSKSAAEISNFRAEEYLGVKGLRNLDRSTRLATSAAKLALDDSQLAVTPENSQEIGVAVGTALGSIRSISDFDREALTEGPRYVSPALFSNTVINSPASRVSIKFNIKGFNATLSSGFSASLDAIGYAADFLKMGRIKAVLAGGVEELCIQTYLAFYRTRCLAGSDKEKDEISSPFDQRRNGVIFGEGACLLVLEDLESATSRGAKIYAEVLASANIFDGARRVSKDGIRRAMQRVLDKAGIERGDIDYICAGANSTKDGDLAETEAIKETFRERAKEIKISSVKSMTGECFSASGAMQTAAAIAALERQIVPPTINYREKDPLCDLDYTPNKAEAAKVDKVLVNSFGAGGNYSSLVISKFYN